MSKEVFKEIIKSKVVILDGATGSNLQKCGMPVGVCPEKWILEHPDTLISLQKEYVLAGSDILYAPTFTANRIKLGEFGLETELCQMNMDLVSLSKRAIELARIEGNIELSRQILIAGDLTMTGKQLYPAGELQFEELVDIYKEQVKVLCRAGVDLFVVETMMSLSECRAAVLAIKESCELPIMVTMTFNENGRTLYGTDPETAMIVLQSMGVDAVGVNCSTGPDAMCEIVRKMKQVAYVPIISKPNAGLPALVDNETIYDLGAEEFSRETVKLVHAGASIVGGCCGTTIEHIRLLAKRCSQMAVTSVSAKHSRVLTTEQRTLSINTEGNFLVVGERINPTGKKELQAELLEGKLDIVGQMAEEQIKNGAGILDVNMGMNGINEKEMMVKAVYELSNTVNVPLCIDSSHPSVIEAALRIYPGRALINSISFEKEKMLKLLPIAKKYGAMFILLPLSESGLPKDIEEKKNIINGILSEAFKQGLVKEDIIVDGLVTTIGANKKAAIETLETIRYCKQELGLATICGLSNISFGLPERQFINSTFLALAIHEGLTMAIANPSQELLMNTAFATDLLLHKEEADIRYIDRVKSHVPAVQKTEYDKENKEKCSKKGNLDNTSNNSLIFEQICKGNRKQIVETIKKSLEQGVTPSAIIDSMLIPAINEVGERFEKQIYFLPQLIASAETMKLAMDYLEPLLHQGEEIEKQGKVVIATVEGDIHDIGKNLVALMLKNYGFEVIDLGKDVKAETIIETAKNEDADIIGLSALMTTTMMNMKKVVTLAREVQLRAKIIIGGAVITQSFANEIGADGYSKDAGEAVRLVKRLLE